MPSVPASRYRSHVRRRRVAPLEGDVPFSGRVFHGVETSRLSANAPSSGDIEGVVQAINPSTLEWFKQQYPAVFGLLGSDYTLRGKWLGGQSRITRRMPSLVANETHMANVWAIPDSVPEAERNAEFDVVGRMLSSLLHAQSSDWSTESFTYNPTYNGDANFWESGLAARTHYRDEWPEMAARFAASENPLGPDSPAVRAPTAGEVVGETGKKVGTAMLLVIGAALAGLVVWNAYKRKGDREERNASFWGRNAPSFPPPSEGDYLEEEYDVEDDGAGGDIEGDNETELENEGFPEGEV